MKQLLLDLALPAGGLNSIITSADAPLLQLLQALIAGQRYEPSLYLWGDVGVGKTHWLRASADSARAEGWQAYYIDAATQSLDDPLYEVANWLAIDNLHTLDDAGQFEFFALYNQQRQQGGVILSSGAVHCQQLPVRADIITRLQWGLQFPLSPLTEADTLAALKWHAHMRGFDLPDDVARYLITHCPRDLRTLIPILQQLDQQSLQQRRHITLPLLRQILQ